MVPGKIGMVSESVPWTMTAVSVREDRLLG